MKTANKVSYAIIGVFAILSILAYAGRFRIIGQISRLMSELPDPPHDQAVVSEFVEERIGSDSYEFIDIDHRPVERERIYRPIDVQPGAALKPGPHSFRVIVSPHPYPHTAQADYTERLATFTATVKGGTRYHIATRSQLPALIEDVRRLPKK